MMYKIQKIKMATGTSGNTPMSHTGAFFRKKLREKTHLI